ncbi:MAG: histidinol dehydrogenase [Syntrophorhabdaceae bacterium]|nr:histidinol dehydrogenase [Syntrophorhabdaceae bacterium]
MKIWTLEDEFDDLIGHVIKNRDQKKRDIRASIDEIREALLKKGDRALVDFGKKWDNWEREYPLVADEEELRDRAKRVDKKESDVLKGMIDNVTKYHRHQGIKKRVYRRKGLYVKEEFVPVEKALVYVPGGRATYPSSLIMGVVPARIAGVKKIYVTTPCINGEINPYVAEAALLMGINSIYRVGGAQAVYAFTYGTETIPKVDMIVGPGNAYVDEAKRDVFGLVGIDMLAGPSELIVFLTEETEAELVAWDLISQAEHDEMAVVGLFSNSKRHIEEIKKTMEDLITGSKRRDIIKKAIDENGFFVYYRDEKTAVDAINRIAPEHLELIGNEAAAEGILYPGIIYLGKYTPVAMGDYYIGTNHVLPTGGAGRFLGGLSVDKFMKRKVVVKIDKGFIERYGSNAEQLSRIEGLYAHGKSIKARGMR